MSFVDDVAVAVSTRVASFASLVASFVSPAAVVTGLGADVIRAVVVTMLGGNVIGMAVLAVGAAVLGAVITAFMATIFVLSVFLHHFFLLLCLPCPGPGMFAEIVFGDFVRQVLVDRD